jgi:hypothetical protein
LRQGQHVHLSGWQHPGKSKPAPSGMGKPSLTASG